MKRNARLMILVILVLFVMPLAFAQNVNALDGDESPESIPYFSETLPDNVMFYPDNESHGSGYAESFVDVSDCLIMDDEGDDTFSSDGDLLHFESKNDFADDGESVYSNVPSLVGQYLEIRYRLNTTSLAVFAVGTYSSDGGLAGNINWFGMTITTSWTTSKFPINSDTVIESVRLYIYHVIGQPPVDLQVDYLRIGLANESGWQHDGSTTEGVSNEIAYSFAAEFTDLTNWYDDIHSSGGVITAVAGIGTMEHTGDGSGKYVGTTDPDPNYVDDEMVGLDISVRHRVNDTTDAEFRYFWRTAMTSTNKWIWTTTEYLSTDWTITNFIVPSGADDVGGLMLSYYAGSVPVKFEIDYIHVGRQIGDTGSISTDGDEVTLTADADGSIFAFDIDTTATQAELATAYYPFLSLDFNDADSADVITVQTFDGTNYFTVLDGVTIGTDALHCNVLVVESYVQQFWITVAATDVVRLDWIKGYGIANWTVTESGVTIDDYLYVDSGTLYSTVDDGHIEANYDPILAVNGATYSIYNLTTHGVDPEFSYYVSGWSAYSDNTRGAIVGIVTGIKLKFDSTEILSAIKFIEDATAPVISDFWIVPYTPTEEDNVTFAIYETDAGVGTYTVIFNAVEYPDGFVDIDLDAVESSEIDGLWRYTIASSDLPAGYYVFEVIASDGANEGTELTIFEVIDVTDNIFELLFLSTEMWGYLGPVGLVVIGYLITKKDKNLGIIFIIVDSLIIWQYLDRIAATPDYWWHVIILLLGVIQCAFQMMDR